MRTLFIQSFLTFFCLPLAACAKLPSGPSPCQPSLRQLSIQPSRQSNIPRVPPSFNINAGGQNSSRFVSDDGPWIVGATSSFVSEESEIGGAEPKNLLMYFSNRYGTHATIWGYDIPVERPGVYNCTAHFAELNYPAVKPGDRVFDLIIATSYGESQVFEQIDIIGDLDGAEFTVLTKTVLDIVITGTLSIRLRPAVGDATLSGLTCLRGANLPENVIEDYAIPSVPSPPPIRPVPQIVDREFNINCGGTAFGHFTAENFAWIRGSTSTFSGPPNSKIGGAEESIEPALLSHRYGINQSSFDYEIPVKESGLYDCDLHFAEIHEGSSSTGARVFDILVMGQTLQDVDIYADAGGSGFRSSVKTFSDLVIESVLAISLIPRVGDAFISAITCVKTAELPDVSQFPAESTEALPSPVVSTPTFESTSSPESTPEASPTMTLNTTTIPSMTPMPPIIDGRETPTDTDEPVMTKPSPSSFPSGSPATVASDPPGTGQDSSSTELNEDLPDPSDGESTIANVDEELEGGAGEVSRMYFLSVFVPGDGTFTERLKDTLMTVSHGSSKVRSTWALTRLDSSKSNVSAKALWIARQAEAEQTYEVDVQAVYDEENVKKAALEYESFVSDGVATKQMKERGYPGVTVGLSKLRSATGSEEPGGGNASMVAVVTVVSLLVVLALSAVIVFMAVNRRRRFAGEDFDPPPPEMSESEDSSVMERSETGVSLDDEYIDDDSTYTAATSRVGEHVDQVSFVKDLFGRGTADVGGTAAHGVP